MPSENLARSPHPKKNYNWGEGGGNKLTLFWLKLIKLTIMNTPYQGPSIDSCHLSPIKTFKKCLS